MKFSPYPKSIVWEITNKCNLKCRYCNASSNEKSCEMKLSDIYKVLKEIGNHKKSTLFLSGG